MTAPRPPVEVVEADVLDGLAALRGRRFALVVSSPPYGIGKSYERGEHRADADYDAWQDEVAARVVDALAPGGAVCWQVGYRVRDGVVTPLDVAAHARFSRLGLELRSRVVWTFGFGRHSTRRFSGRHETLLWLSRPGGRGLGPDVPGFSPRAAFVEDPVWRLPNVVANHPEKTAHPCQFPIELAERCVLALSAPGEAVLDPFAGSGATLLAAAARGRAAVGIERDPGHAALARARVAEQAAGRLRRRAFAGTGPVPDEGARQALDPKGGDGPWVG